MSASPIRTHVRDSIVARFQALKDSGHARQSDFEVLLRWINPDQSTQRSTVCVIATDEQRESLSLRDDRYNLTVTCVLVANDSTDPRARLDRMIEDAIETVLLAASTLRNDGAIIKASLDAIESDEGALAAGPWAQAVMRWTIQHTRAALVI